MDSASCVETAPAVAVVRIEEGWVLLFDGRRWGRYQSHAQALGAAERLRLRAHAQGDELEILDQESWGEIVRLAH